jgi:uncharacterized protein (DUF433 family)
MNGRDEMLDRRITAELLATVNEAAFVSGVTRRAVNQAIDRGEIRSRRLRRATDAPGRAIGVAELIYLRLSDFLSTKGRRAVYKKLNRIIVEMKSFPSTVELEGGVRLDITGSVADIRAKLDELTRIKSRVEENPEIRGGEAVFRGTRIPVEMIATFVQQGVPAGEILEDYPALDADALQIARRYVELYPRRGRPKQAPWRAQEPMHVINPEDPRG